MVSKILVGYDGTPSSDRALEFGLDLAEKYSASISILNVVELPVFGNSGDPIAVSAGVAGFIKDLRGAHEFILTKAKEKAAILKPNIVAMTTLKEGNPPDQIVSTAAEDGFDIVVVGHGGEGRLTEMFLGGVSERVAHMARCTVVIAR